MMRPDVRPEMLRWACERAGIDSIALTERVPQLPAWMRGERKPTLRQLERFATIVRIPIGYLFFAEPLVERVPIPDFRTIANRSMVRPSPDLLDTVYLCQQRQYWYRDHALAVGEEPLPFVGSARTTDDVVQTAAAIRDSLSFDLDERRTLPNWTVALRRFIAQADGAGVLVMVSGVVGSNTHRKLDPQEFRGFALVDDRAPVIFVNGADTKAAQMFTVAHELAHVWVGESALSDTDVRGAPDHGIERWCNQVAAELLAPLAIVREEYDHRAELRAEVDRLARRFKVSTLVVLRRIHDAGGLARGAYQSAYQTELELLRRQSNSSGGDFYLTLDARVSRRFVRALVTSALEGRSSFTEAFRLLGFRKVATFQRLQDRLGIIG